MPVQEGPGFLIALKISSGPSAGSGGGSLYSGRRIPSSQVKNLLRVPQQRAPAHCMSPSLACSSCFSPPTESGGLHVDPASISECSMAQKSLDCGSWGHSVMWLSYFSGPPKCCHIQPHQSIFCAHARLLSPSLSMGNFLHHQHQRREIGHLPLPVSRKARASHSDGRGAATEQRGSVTTDYFHYFISGPKML